MIGIGEDMVSWDMKVKFFGHSPNVKELVKLAKEHEFSNIEDMTQLEIDEKGSATYWLSVNERGLKQKEFKYEVVK